MSAPRKIRRRAVLGGLAIAASAAISLGTIKLLKGREPITIGFLGPLTGPLAFVGQTNLTALSIAADEINAANGILGRKLEIAFEDSQMSTKVSLDKATKLLAVGALPFLTGMVLPAEREAVLTPATAHKALVAYPNFDEGRCHANLLTTGLSANQAIDPFASWLVANIGKTLYVLASDLATNRDVLVPRIRAAFENAGGKLVGVQYFPFGTRDFGPALQQVRGIDPAIVWHIIGDDPITIVKQYKRFDMKPQLVTQIMHESIAAATEGASTGVLAVSSYFMSISTPANERFIRAFSERFSGFTTARVKGNVVVLPHGEQTYVGARLFAEAARSSGSLELERLKSAFDKVSAEVPRGTVRIDGASGHVISPPLVGRVLRDNSIEIVARLELVKPVCNIQ